MYNVFGYYCAATSCYDRYDTSVFEYDINFLPDKKFKVSKTLNIVHFLKHARRGDEVYYYNNCTKRI